MYVPYRETKLANMPPALLFKEPDYKFLRVRILEGVVPIMDFDGLCDPYVEVDTGMQTWTTKVIKETLTPQWKEETVLGVYDTEKRDAWGIKLPEECLGSEITLRVKDWNASKDVLIGTITLKKEDVPGYHGEEILEPPAPHWFPAVQEDTLVGTLVNSDAGKWLSGLLFEEKIKSAERMAKGKLRSIHAFESGVLSVRKKLPKVYAQSGPKALEKAAEALEKAAEAGTETDGYETGGEVDAADLQAEADNAPAGGRSETWIKAQIWFDNTWNLPPSNIVGQLMVKIVDMDIEKRAGGKARAPMVVLRYNKHWVRMQTNTSGVINSSGMPHYTYDSSQAFTFGVTELGEVLTVAIFDDAASRMIDSSPKFLGLLKIRPTVLGGNEWYTTTLPLYQRYGGGVKQRGKVTLSICLGVSSAGPLIGGMFKPPRKDEYYYLLEKYPWMEKCENQITKKSKDNLFGFLTAQEKPKAWHKAVVQQVLNESVKQLDLDLLFANIGRLKDSFGKLADVGEYLVKIMEWKNFWESACVNLFLVFLICFIEWAPSLLIIYLVYSFIVGAKRRKDHVIAHMESDLFGNVVARNKYQTEEDLVAQEEEPEAEEKEEEKEEEPEEEERSAWAEVEEVIKLVVTAQDGLGLAAGMVERVKSIVHWTDPRISMLVTIILIVALPALYFVPLKLVISFVISFVIRHPKLRDPIPPPPVNLVFRLPSRDDQMLIKESQNRLLMVQD
uniref:C2 domain-containing protein n=1 Tax=Eutreptiella gymnastica TaxID=73025 RepID=A0A7S1IPN7_9EUGL